MPRADGPFRVLKDGVEADPSADLRANPFQQEGYDVPHHGRIKPSSPREEEPKFESPTTNYKGPNTRSMAKFVNLVTYLDNKGMCKGDLNVRRELESSSVQNEKVTKCHNSWR